MNNTVRQFAELQSQAAEFSLQKLQEIIAMTQNQPEDTPIDTSLQQFGQTFGLYSPITG